MMESRGYIVKQAILKRDADGEICLVNKAIRIAVRTLSQMEFVNG